ncbi:MAG TPA: hypothetical protein VN924_24075, partial [Bryobacteraceae bacterium]|nr:hypothetical protein [Bryobacteraceae bacterium]
TKPLREEALLEKMGALLNIPYDYEETNEAEGQAMVGAAALSAHKLRQLPPELLEEMLNATTRGDKNLLDKLIAEVREAGEADSAHALQVLADKYEYDALTGLLEECRAGHGPVTA